MIAPRSPADKSVGIDGHFLRHTRGIAEPDTQLIAVWINGANCVEIQIADVAFRRWHGIDMRGAVHTGDINRELLRRRGTQRINGLRGFLRELGYAIPTGAKTAQRRTRDILDEDNLPAPLIAVFGRLLEEIATLETDIAAVERQLNALTRNNTDVARLRAVDGIGLLTSTAMLASAGSAHHFPDGRHFASWIGLTPREYSSGNRRYLGKISKQGDSYLRMLLTHGARSVLTRAKTLKRAGKSLNRLQAWACQLEQRVGHNKATCAIANKLARICWAVWKHQRDFDPNRAVA